MMKRTWLSLRIWWLKRKARKLRAEMSRLRDGYDCGHTLMNYVSGSIAWREEKYNEVVSELARIDPGFPYRGDYY